MIGRFSLSSVTLAVSVGKLKHVIVNMIANFI